MSSEMIHYRPAGQPVVSFRQQERNVGGLRFVAFFLLLLLFAFSRELFAQSSNARPAVRMEAIPTRIYQGESLRLQIHLDNFEKFETPDIAYLKETFDVEYLGEQNRNSSMIVIINGKQQKTEEKGMTYNYRLTPKQAGKFRIEPPEIRYGNVVATAFPVSIEVIPPGNQDDIQLKLSASTKEIYPMIPFTVKLEIYVRELPGSLAKNDPVQIIAQQVGLPSLFLPWLEDEQFTNGLTARQNWEDWISKYRNSKGGFIVNNIRAKSAFPVGFSLFDSRWSDAIAFLPKGTVVEIKNKDGSTGRFWRYEFSRSFLAEKPGDYLFGGASIKGLFAKEDENNKLVANDVYVLSNPVTVTVKDVPEEGRPDNYIGVFGNFDWKATLAPEKALLGEAMTLTLSLEGNGSLHNIKQPDLEHNPAVTANFKVYKPTEEIKENVARFTYALRPIKEGKVEFPAISVSSFDVEKGKFVTLQTNPINVEVDGNAAGQTVASGVTPDFKANGKTSLSRAAGGIFGNLSDHSGAVNQKITLQDWGKEIALLGGIGFLFWGAVLCLRNDRFIAGRRRSNLLAAAGRQIRESLELLATGETRTVAAAASGIRTAFLSPAAECFGKSVTTLTEAEVRNVLNELIEQANGNEPSSSEALRYLPPMANRNGGTSATLPAEMSEEDVQLIQDLRELFARLEEVQYGFDATTVREIRERSPILFDRWSGFTAVKKNRKRIRAIVVALENRKFGNGSSSKSAKEDILKGKNLMLFLAMSLSLLFTGCTAPQNDNTRNEFQRAIKTFEEADSLSELADSKKEATSADKTSPDKMSPDKEKTRARQKELFKKSAAIYQGLIDAGTESGPILYNQGNAWMRAGEEALALAAWRKAKRYMPVNAWLNANIETIAPHFQGEKGKPLAEHLMFWQNWISYPVKYRLSVAFGIALLIGTIILVLLTTGKTKKEGSETAPGHAKNIKWITGILLAFFLVITCSALYDWHRFDHTKHVIVTESEVIARKGNSLQYNPVFSEPLPKLTDGILLEEQNNWLRVRFSDGQEGWIPARSTVRY